MNGFIENLSLTEFCVMYFTLNERFFAGIIEIDY